MSHLRNNSSTRFSMFRLLKPCAWALLLLLGLRSAQAFSLLGPVNEAYQQPVIGYNLPGDIGAPKNLAEEYRWNIPIFNYAFDASFLDYFASNGIVAVESAIAIINDLTNYPYSTLNPDDWPLEARRVNGRAQALQLLDVKSATLQVIVEELGLAEPDRWVWTLRDRRATPQPCPFMIYDVIRRNFDPITYQPSSYVNGTLFSYVIQEFCTGPNPLAYTLNFPVDQTSQDFTSVAAGAASYGHYWTGLTRDDVGGLKYLMRTNNVNWEQVSTDSTLFATNTSQAQFLVTSNLALLASQARTNDAATLAALYPGLIITSSSNTFRFTWVTNIVAYFTNYPMDPVGAAPHLVFGSNRTWTVQSTYHHTFGNLFTFRDTANGWTTVPLATVPTATSPSLITIETIAATNSPWLPYGVQPATNLYYTSYWTNQVAGDYFILPTNACDVKIIERMATVRTFATNLIVQATNTFQGTNTTSTNTFLISQNLIDSSLTRIFLYYPVECLSTSTPALRQGIDSIRFVRQNYDSLIGRFYKPITNLYSLISITNGLPFTNWVQRVSVFPDWVFSAQDGLEGDIFRSVPFYRTNGSNLGLAGPGTFDPFVGITYNKVGPLNIHVYGGTNVVLGGLHELGGVTNFIWASFNGSTNEPIVYPVDTRLDDIERLIYFQVTTVDLPEATIGVPYRVPLQVFGGVAPYRWEPAETSAPLPLDLALTPDGYIDGIPEEDGTFTFTVTVIDAGGRTASRTLTIKVNPLPTQL